MKPSGGAAEGRSRVSQIRLAHRGEAHRGTCALRLRRPDVLPLATRAREGDVAPQAASQAIWVCRKLSRLAGGRPHIEPAALHQQARIQLLKGRPARARKLLSRAIASAQKLGMPPFEALARFSLAQVQTLPMPERLDHLDVATTMFRKMGFSWHLEASRGPRPEPRRRPPGQARNIS